MKQMCMKFYIDIIARAVDYLLPERVWVPGEGLGESIRTDNRSGPGMTCRKWLSGWGDIKQIHTNFLVLPPFRKWSFTITNLGGHSTGNAGVRITCFMVNSGLIMLHRSPGAGGGSHFYRAFSSISYIDYLHSVSNCTNILCWCIKLRHD